MSTDDFNCVGKFGKSRNVTRYRVTSRNMCVQRSTRRRAYVYTLVCAYPIRDSIYPYDCLDEPACGANGIRTELTLSLSLSLSRRSNTDFSAALKKPEAAALRTPAANSNSNHAFRHARSRTSIKPPPTLGNARSEVYKYFQTAAKRVSTACISAQRTIA